MDCTAEPSVDCWIWRGVRRATSWSWRTTEARKSLPPITRAARVPSRDRRRSLIGPKAARSVMLTPLAVQPLSERVTRATEVPSTTVHTSLPGSFGPLESSHVGLLSVVARRSTSDSSCSSSPTRSRMPPPARLTTARREPSSDCAAETALYVPLPAGPLIGLPSVSDLIAPSATSMPWRFAFSASRDSPAVADTSDGR